MVENDNISAFNGGGGQEGSFRPNNPPTPLSRLRKSSMDHWLRFLYAGVVIWEPFCTVRVQAISPVRKDESFFWVRLPQSARKSSVTT